jgi:aryl-alcohol dehydrogenase-like predicted oxidoreductase
MITIVGQEDK